MNIKSIFMSLIVTIVISEHQAIGNEAEEIGLEVSSIKEKIIGRWEATITDSSFVYIVIIEFKSDGTFTALNKDNRGAIIFYDSTDDSNSNRYEIDGLNDNGYAYGRKIIKDNSGNTHVHKLDSIRFSNDFNSLEFDFWYDLNEHTLASNYGPIRFELTRK